MLYGEKSSTNFADFNVFAKIVSRILIRQPLYEYRQPYFENVVWKGYKLQIDTWGPWWGGGGGGRGNVACRF